jgi:hypothetical protein
LNRFDTDTKTAFLDLYTKVDAEATAPVEPKNDVQVETTNDPNSGNLNIRVTKNGQTKEMVLTPMDMVEHQGSGLTEHQIIDRVAKTLVATLDREANEMPF